MSKNNPATKIDKNYFASAEKTRAALTRSQQKNIRKMYKDLSKSIKDRANAMSLKSNISSIIGTGYLEDLKNQIDAEIRDISLRQYSVIQKNALDVAEAVRVGSNKMINAMGIDVKAAYSFVPREVVNGIFSGKLYEGRWNLSSAIWGNSKKTMSDINYIIAQGVASQRSTYDIAKDLEKYVNPSASKDWAWSKVYPKTSKRVDYNAQRLARTMVSHAYEDALLRTTQDNPFVDAYQWLASNSDRTCEECRSRESDYHGVIIDGHEVPGAYYAGDLPLDHPNGMCTVEAVIPHTFNEIGQRLAGWVNGNKDEGLDNFAVSLGYSAQALKDKVR